MFDGNTSIPQMKTTWQQLSNLAKPRNLLDFDSILQHSHAARIQRLVHHVVLASLPKTKLVNLIQTPRKFEYTNETISASSATYGKRVYENVVRGPKSLDLPARSICGETAVVIMSISMNDFAASLIPKTFSTYG